MSHAYDDNDDIHLIDAELAHLADLDDPATRLRVLVLLDAAAAIATATGVDNPPPLLPHGSTGPVTAAQEARWASECRPERATWHLWVRATESVFTARDLLARWRVAGSRPA